MYSKFNKAAILAVLAMPLMASPVFAQSTGPSKKAQDSKASADDYKPVGARVGTFIFFPDLNVETVHDTNYYKQKTGAEDIDYTTFKPSASLRSDWNNHSLRLDGSIKRGEFWGSSADNFTEGDARARGKIDVSKDTAVNLEGRYQALTEARGGDDVATDAAEPTEYSQSTAKVSFKTKPNRVSVSGGLAADRYDYKDSRTLTGGTTINQDRDRDEYVANGRLGYEIQEGYEGFVRGEYGIVDYRTKVDGTATVGRNSDGYKMETGVALQLSKLLRGDVGIGWLSRSYDDAALKDISGYSANGSLTWSVTPLTDIRAKMSRGIDETTTASTSGNLTTGYGIGVDHELLRNLKLTADAKYDITDYEGDPNKRKDDKITLSAGLKYEINRNLYAGMGYTYENRDSTSTNAPLTNDYSRSIYKVNVGLRF